MRIMFACIYVVALAATCLADTTKYEFRKSMLDRHNELRIKHNAAPIVFVLIIDEAAQSMADDASRSPHSDLYGVNWIYDIDKTNVTGADVTDIWYNYGTAFYWDLYDKELTKENVKKLGGRTERRNVSHVANADNAEYVVATQFVSFTNIVWKSTLNIGIGVNDMDNGMMNVVACYDPTGNIFGQFVSNVMSPNSSYQVPLPFPDNS